MNRWRNGHIRDWVDVCRKCGRCSGTGADGRDDGVGGVLLGKNPGIEIDGGAGNGAGRTAGGWAGSNPGITGYAPRIGYSGSCDAGGELNRIGGNARALCLLRYADQCIGHRIDDNSMRCPGTRTSGVAG